MPVSKLFSQGVWRTSGRGVKTRTVEESSPSIENITVMFMYFDLSSITTGTAVGLEMTERTTKKAEWIH